MKLLLDEQLSPDIAVRLRERQHDVVAVCERPDLVASDDEALLGLALSENRALLTNNVRDFVRIASRWAGEGRSHGGLLFVSDRTLPRSRDTIGAYVRALEACLRAHPADDALGDRIHWLQAEPA